MNRYLPVVPILAVVTTITLQSQPLLALERTEIAAKAKEFTVQIEGQETTGTGTIIDRNGNTYTILTCWHVVNAEGSFEITTADGATHQVTEVKNIADVDLAILQFTSNTTYQVAELGDSQTITEGTNTYVVGYPDPFPGFPERNYTFLNANVVSKSATGKDGYQILHDNPSTPGGSGGGIFDTNGRLVGINGQFISEGNTGKAYGKGIPLEIYLAAKSSFTTPTNITPPQDFVSVGRRKLKQDDYQGAIDEFNQALASNPNDIDALSGRAEAYLRLEAFPSAIQDFDVVLQRNPNNATFFFYRGYAHGELKEYELAIADYTEAIRLNPDYAYAYYNRGISYYNRGEYELAIADYTEAIRLNPDYAYAYNNRGNSYNKLGEYEQAIVDLKEAIRLNPDLAEPYNNRGNSYEKLGDKQKAIEDFQQAADLDQQQGNTEYYQDALDRIRELQ